MALPEGEVALWSNPYALRPLLSKICTLPGKIESTLRESEALLYQIGSGHAAITGSRSVRKTTAFHRRMLASNERLGPNSMIH